MKLSAGSRGALVGALAVLGLALAVRLPGIGQEAGGDELYHILAARQYLADGTLAIPGGEPYTRAEAFTRIVAVCFRLFGASPEAARIPSLLAGSLTAVAVFLWLYRLGERGGAWLAALLVAVDPELIKLSQWARFYTVQNLAFLLGAIASFALLDNLRRPLRSALLLGGAVACFRFALDLQVITEIGMAGVGLYACLRAAPLFWDQATARGRGLALMVGVAGAASLAIFLLHASGVFREARQLAVEVDLWALEHARNWRYYHGLLQEGWPTLWTLFPLLLLGCAMVQPRLALFCACIFGTAFSAHSLVALKHVRYISYVLPFFLVPSGVAVARVVPALARRAAEIPLPWSVAPRIRRLLATAAVAGAAAFAVLANPALVRTARLVGMDPALRQPGMEHDGLSWKRAARRLSPLASGAEVLVSADDLSALFYLHRLDFVLSATQLDLEGTGEEFTRDPRTGAPLVTRPESMERIVACSGSGLLVGRSWSFATRWAVPPETAAWIRDHMEAVPLPPEWGIEAFTWTTQDPLPDPRCPRPRNATFGEGS